MELSATIGGAAYAINLKKPHDLSLPVRFDAQQMKAFGAPPATSTPLEVGGFVGSVARGGSCNCEVHHFCAHTSGTHTECVGHITRTPLHVTELLPQQLLPATLVTVTPVAANTTGETYDPLPQSGDRLITAALLEAALQSASHAFLPALIVRSMPNDLAKKTCDYSTVMPPYFTHEAMAILLQHGVQHLLVDLPSIDRLDDEGKLSNHRLFWGLEPGSTDAGNTPSPRTITELLYVENAIADGNYLLNLGVAPILADASPSRPLLYEVTRA